MSREALEIALKRRSNTATRPCSASIRSRRGARGASATFTRSDPSAPH